MPVDHAESDSELENDNPEILEIGDLETHTLGGDTYIRLIEGANKRRSIAKIVQPDDRTQEIFEALVSRYNAFPDLAGVLQDIHSHADDWAAINLASKVLEKHGIEDRFGHSITFPENEEETDVNSLEVGDELHGRVILKIDYIESEEGYSELAIVTRRWGERFGETEYATHVLNLKTEGGGHGKYTTDWEEAQENHQDKIDFYSKDSDQ